MSVQTQIDRINQNIANTYSVLGALGTDMPAARTSDNLAATAGTAKAVLYSAQTLTKEQKAQARANIGAVSEVDVPQKGVDYWTLTDQEEIVQQVIAALGTPVFGRVDGENNIILTGELTNGTYTLKYEGVNGNVADIGSVTITDGNDMPETPQVINQLPISTDTDGSIFNGTGYKVGHRLNSSSAVTTIDVPGASNPVFVTGFIPVQQGQTVRLKDCYIDTDGINGSPSSTETKNYYGHATGSLNVLICNSTKTTQHVVNWGAVKTVEHFTVTPDSQGIVTEITCNKVGMAYLRLVLAGDPTKAVITVE